VVRPGPRLVDGVEAFASVLHPEVFDRSALVRRVR
jgi:iron complex transport system substrate-binding protein